MQHMDIRKKRRSNWPWLAGVIVFALLAWGVTSLLSADEPATDPEAVADSAADDAAPAEIPMPPRAPYTGPSSPTLDELAPLGPGVERKQAHANGEVVATGTDGFWLLAEGRVIRVDSPRHVRRGDTVMVEGTLQAADPDRTDRIVDAVLQRDPSSREWTVVRKLKLVTDSAQAELEARGDEGTPRVQGGEASATGGG